MNKKCARCLKTVYPVEELKCLDKIWHKSCFRCTECGMALTLKNYKGYNRMPYCSAHTPKAKATPIASTPELKRLTNNTRIQSNIKYHEDYERGKGRSHPVSEESETVRNKQTPKSYSNVAYRVCKYEHKNIVEQRKRELGDILRNNSSSRSGLDDSSSSSMRPSLGNLQNSKSRSRKPLPNSASNYSNYSASSISSPKVTNLAYKSSKFIRKLSSSSNSFGSSLASMDSRRSLSKEKVNLQRLDAGNTPQNVEEIYLRRAFDNGSQSRSSVESAISEIDGKASDTNGLTTSNEGTNSSNITLTDSTTIILPQTASKWKQEEKLQEIKYFETEPTKEFPKEESADELDEPTTSPQNTSQLERKSSNSLVNVYRAAYDFTAQDTDEVSFFEGDRIIEVEPENSGWITARVERTGKIGLVPANYLECLKDINTQTEIVEKSAQSENEKVFDTVLTATEK